MFSLQFATLIRIDAVINGGMTVQSLSVVDLYNKSSTTGVHSNIGSGSNVTTNGSTFESYSDFNNNDSNVTTNGSTTIESISNFLISGSDITTNNSNTGSSSSSISSNINTMIPSTEGTFVHNDIANLLPGIQLGNISTHRSAPVLSA